MEIILHQNFPLTAYFQLAIRKNEEGMLPFLPGSYVPTRLRRMVIRYCSFATRGYRLRQWMQMISLRLADTSIELFCWNFARLVREGVRESIPWFDPNLQGAGFWVWKTFIILKELAHLEERDYLL